jgi:Rrf2 family cysteine metabolism transcriptional repressor
MKLSTRARYALRLMLEIARQSDGKSPVSLSQVAERGDLPRRYLEQLVIALKRDSLLRGVSGKDGGYCLTRPPSEIKVGEIVESAIGQISIVDCVEDPRQCLKSALCECRPMYALINQRITEVLNEFSLADMLENKWHQGVFEGKESKTMRPSAQAKPPPGAEKAVAK